MKSVLVLFSCLMVPSIVFSQLPEKDAVLINKFNDVFSALVSDDEKNLIMIVDNNKFELYSLDPIKFIKQYKVTRNTWLEKAFFGENNTVLYYDYGMQMSPKFIKINLSNGKKEKVDCNDVPKGCSHVAIKYCDSKNTELHLDKYILRRSEIDLLIYEIQ